jgi:hypothetical protein
MLDNGLVVEELPVVLLLVLVLAIEVVGKRLDGIALMRLVSACA